MPLLGVQAVIAVARLERAKPPCHKARDVLVHRRQPRMGEDDSAGAANLFHHGAQRGTGAGHERRTPFSEQAIERIAPIARMTGVDERVGERRTSDASARRQRCDCGFDVHRAPELLQARRDLASAANALLPLALEELEKHGRPRIEEISKNVHVPASLNRGDLDAVHQPNAGLFAERRPSSRPATVSWSVMLMTVSPAATDWRTSSEGCRRPSEAVVWR